jgi:hypothetical protein
VKVILADTDFTSSGTENMTISNTVSTELLYFVPPPDDSKPYFNINHTANGVSRNYSSAAHCVDIENLRGKEDSASLDTTGFQFFRHPQKYTSFASDEEIEREYYPDSIALVKEITGASRIVPFDHSALARSCNQNAICSLVRRSYPSPPSRRSR